MHNLRDLGFSVMATGDATELGSSPLTRAAADYDLVGQTDIDFLGEIFRNARLVVGLDGGGPRLAAAVGVPTVVLSIGYSWSKVQVMPWMVPGEVVEPDLRCSECVLQHCSGTGSTCSRSLRPDSVLAACHRVLVKTDDREILRTPVKM